MSFVNFKTLIFALFLGKRKHYSKSVFILISFCNARRPLIKSAFRINAAFIRGSKVIIKSMFILCCLGLECGVDF